MTRRVAGPYLLFGTVVILALALYTPTVPPSVLPGDSGEFAFTIPTLGIAHPTGYPLYLLTGRALALLPFGDLAFRANLTSAFWGALALGVFAVVAARLAGGGAIAQVAAAIAAVRLATSELFWSQAIVAEVYSFHLLLLALILGLWLAPPGRWRPGARWSALALAVGLGLAHHRTTGLILPLLIVDGALALLGRRHKLRYLARPMAGGAVVMALALAIPMALYLYYPLRAPAAAALLEMPLANGEVAQVYPPGVDGFLDWATGRRFGNEIDLQFGDAFLARAGAAWTAYADAFRGLGLVLAALGMALSVRRPANALRLIGAGAVFTGFALVYAIGDIAAYYLPMYLITSIWIAMGLAGVMRLPQWALRRTDRRRILQTAGAATLGAFGLIWALPMFPLTERPERTTAALAGQRTDQLLAAIGAARGALASDDRDELTPLFYAQQIQGRGRNLSLWLPNQAPDPAFKNVVTILEAIPPGQPIWLAKRMPGLESKFVVTDQDPPRILGTSLDGAPITPLEAKFSGGLGLEGLDLNATSLRQGRPLVRAEPGERLGLRSRWSADGPQGPTATFVQVVGTDGVGVAGSDRRPGGVFFPPSAWRVGERLNDPHELTLPATVPIGVYEIWAGAYDPETKVRRTLPDGSDHAVIGRLVVPPAPTNLPPETTIAFEAGMEFLAGALPGRIAVRRGQPLTVTLFWRGTHAIDRAYTVFVQALDSSGRLVAQHDQQPLKGAYPTWAWDERVFADPVTLDLATAPPGVYRLIVGLYDSATGVRLRQADGADLIEFARLQID